MRPIRADRRLGWLLGGVVLLSFVALGGSVALPASDPEVRSTEGARELTPVQEAGRAIYRSEGCWYCHTQQVRTTPTDAVFGSPLSPGAYAHEQPVMVGAERIGPDLTHVGTRYDDADELMALLREPRRDGRPSSMPSYDFLSDEQLNSLVAYLLSLR